MNPDSAKNEIATDALAEVNRRFANRLTSSMGSSVRSSRATNAAASTAVSAKLPIMYAPPIAEVRYVHRVKSGDTLSGIAKRYRLRVSDLKRWNQGVGLLRINQKIYIRKG